MVWLVVSIPAIRRVKNWWTAASISKFFLIISDARVVNTLDSGF